MMPPFSRLFTALLLLLVCPAPHAGAQISPVPGGLDFFVTDAALWRLPAAELPERLKAFGYTVDAAAGTSTLGEPRDMMKRSAHLFLPDLAVWKATLSQRATLAAVSFDLLPPATLTKALTKPSMRTLTKQLEEQLSAVMKSSPTQHPNDYGTAPPPYKVTSQRWVGKNVQAVLMTAVTETRTAFTVQSITLRLLPVIPPGKSPVAKALAAKIDRGTGVVLLEGFPALPQWEGSHPAWAVLEQALWAIGLDSDRNGILECYGLGTGWVVSFATGLQRLATMAGGKVIEVSPVVHQSSEILKLTKSCEAAAKKLGKRSPQSLDSLQDVDPDVLRAARSSGNGLTQFTAALKQAIAAGRPLFWYGWTGLYPETPATTGTTPVVRLMIGYAPKEGDVIFADAAGKPGIRMKLADALAASLYTVDISK